MNSKVNGIKIRNAEVSDVDDLVALLEELFSIEADFSFDADRQHRGLLMLLYGIQSPSCVKVAEMDGRIVGMVTVQALISTAEGNLAGVIEDLVVREDYRGQGVGARLLRSVEAWARKENIRRLQLLADRENFPALEFYDNQKWMGTQLIALRKML